MGRWLVATLLALGLAGRSPAQTQPLLQLQGQPYFGGTVSLHVSGAVGQPALLAYGLNPLPLDQPLQTGKGPWYIGSLVNLVSLGTIPTGGRINLPLTMPPLMPALIGVSIGMQAYVPRQLSNPATLPLDGPYFVPSNAGILASPLPAAGGQFGDRVAIGDLNGDMQNDVVVSGWFEDAAGVESSGRAYVFWGPTFDVTTVLESPTPIPVGVFGQGLAIADFDGDEIDDLVITEGNGDPPPPTTPGHAYYYGGGTAFASTPAFSVPSAGGGGAYQIFGHQSVVADVSGDGLPDFVNGAATQQVQGKSNAGQIDVHYGPNLGQVVSVVAPDVDTNGFFGDRLAAADANGDGLADIIIGAPRKSLNGTAGAGRVYVYASPGFSHLATIDHPDPAGVNSRFGNDVVARDLNGDGLADIVATDQRNHAYVFWSPGYEEFVRVARPPDSVSGTDISISFGYYVTVGDANADSAADIVIGEPLVASITGRVYVSLAPYFSTFLVLTDDVPAVGNGFGWGLHLQNVDADSRMEFITGSTLSDPGGVSGAGHVTIFDLNN